MVSGRLNEHLIKNSMFDPLQSVYRDKHSTETALIKVQNDILSALDAGSSAILLMLDLSATFDTIDHDIIGDALDWFRSYLTSRIQRVVIEDDVSGDQELGFGVPQGSVLGIRKYIPQDTSVVLVKSLVMSRLDYSNGLFYGLPRCTVSGLQVVQNSAARIVTQERLQDHDSMSRALIGLHWLPVDKRI